MTKMLDLQDSQQAQDPMSMLDSAFNGEKLSHKRRATVLMDDPTGSEIVNDAPEEPAAQTMVRESSVEEKTA